jgi:hypothetical protein
MRLCESSDVFASVRTCKRPAPSPTRKHGCCTTYPPSRPSHRDRPSSVIPAPHPSILHPFVTPAPSPSFRRPLRHSGALFVIPAPSSSFLHPLPSFRRPLPSFRRPLRHSGVLSVIPASSSSFLRRQESSDTPQNKQHHQPHDPRRKTPDPTLFRIYKTPAHRPPPALPLDSCLRRSDGETNHFSDS